MDASLRWHDDSRGHVIYFEALEIGAQTSFGGDGVTRGVMPFRFDV